LAGSGQSAAPSSPRNLRTNNLAPGSYTPKHLAEKILASRSALEGERKQVTVLFADVKGSMELAEQLDAEEWHRIMDRFFQILTEGVHRFEGTVNQYTGDGIMALFGAPIAHEDHAQRACYAALSLQGRLARSIEA
jgi:class 3 adenylate cyclase